MNLDDVIAELRDLKVDVPIPLRLPSVEEVDAEETELGVRFHPDFRKYLLEASDVIHGTIEPVSITRPTLHTYLRTVIEDSRELGLPEGMVPICYDNGDVFGVTKEGTVEYWSHNGKTDESWSSIAEWITKVWIQN